MRKILRLLVPILALALMLQGCDTDSESPDVAPEPAVCDPACADGESCVDGACVADTSPDEPVTCTPDAEQVCTCDDGAEGAQHCNDAGDGYGDCFCTSSPTGGPAEDCDPACAEGQSCVEGSCVDEATADPCAEVTCEDDQACVDGVCEDNTTEPPAPQCQSFADVTVVFEDNGCLGCHGGSGGLSLGSHAEATAKVVTPGDGANSTLVTKLKSATVVSGSAMPLGNPDSVSDEDIALLVEWIDGGALETCE